MKKSLFIILTLNSFNCFSEATENISYQYYEVNPLPHEGLNEAAFKATPRRQQGEKFLGCTYWKFYWNYSYNTNQQGCFITHLTVHTDIKVILPKLISNDHRKHTIFNSFLEKLKYHELNHVKIASQYGKNLNDTLQKLPIQNNCEQLKSTIDKIGLQFSNDAQQANDKYDHKTNHGTTEGAVLVND